MVTILSLSSEKYHPSSRNLSDEIKNSILPVKSLEYLHKLIRVMQHDANYSDVDEDQANKIFEAIAAGPGRLKELEFPSIVRN